MNYSGIAWFPCDSESCKIIANKRLINSDSFDTNPSYSNIIADGVARGCGGAGRTGRHLLRAANGRKL